jgi:hypothetical protein
MNNAGKTQTPFGLRMPPELKASVEASARGNNRSMNAEIVARLEAPSMTLRDYFAAKALQGLLACSETQGVSHECFASNAFDYADAMIAAREAKP